MKRINFVIILILLLTSCKNSSNSAHTISDGKDSETIYTVTGEDKEMNEAIETANKTIDNFKKALISNDPNYKYFALKRRFNTAKGGEHIWISNIKIVNDNYYGVVDNLPESTDEVKLGDTIKIEPDKISDWMFLDEDKLIGGYTIRVLRNRMTEKERKQFDKESNFTIDN
jgi:uncharacterized protein YegJ (DUF2314 family)